MKEEIISVIDIAELTEKDIGKWVIYDDGFKKEVGRIKSWNDKYVFVVYKCDNQWHRFWDYTGCATDPEDLEFDEEEVKFPWE